VSSTVTSPSSSAPAPAPRVSPPVPVSFFRLVMNVSAIYLVAGDESSHVDDVRVEVAVRAGACRPLLEPPQKRDRFIGPVLEVGRSHVPDLADLARFDELVRQRHGRAAPIVEPDERLDARLLGGLHHAAGVVERAGQRLLAGAGLAGRYSGLGHRGVHVVRRDDVDQADLRRLDQRFPIGRRVLPTPVGGKRLRVLFRLAKHRVHHGLERRPEELGDLPPGVRMGTTHKALPDQGYVDRLHSGLLGNGEHAI